MGISVGIDLGTTNCAVAWINPASGKPEIIPNSEGEPITPSVIRFLDNGTHICGQDAKDDFEMGQPGCVCAFKRHMGTDKICLTYGGKSYTARDLSTILLKHLKADTEEALGKTVTEAVITVPAYFTNAEREDTLKAAQQAGLKVKRIINEPTAAALCYGLGHWRENAIIMVYDLGGGTFDVSLVGMAKDGGMDVIGTLGDHKLGGKDWDAALVELVADRFYETIQYDVRQDPDLMKIFESNAETWKKALSRSTATADVKVYIPELGEDYTVKIHRSEFAAATQHYMDQTLGCCDALLKKAALTWRNVTDILLVGGSTRMPQVAEKLEQLTGRKPLMHTNPDAAVALGAAIQLALPDEDYEEWTVVAKPKKGIGAQKAAAIPEGDAILSRFRGPVGKAQESDLLMMRKRDVQPHGMGVISVSPDGKEYINENIIPPSSRIPIKAARAFAYYTSAHEKNEVEIYVLEGTDAPLRCEIREKYVASGISHVSGGPATIRVQYSFDRNGIIHVQARQGNENRDLPIRREPINYAEMEKFGKPIPEENRVSSAERTIVMAVDVSGSMYSRDAQDICAIDRAKEAMCKFAQDYAGTGVKVGAMCVSDSTKWVIRPTSDISKCVKAIKDIECCCTGVGNETDPFDDILNELGSCKGERYAIVMADGAWYHQDKAIQKAQRCHQKGIEIAAIGFGTADTRFLDKISSKKDLAIMTTQTELSRSFGKIAQSIGGGGSRSGKSNETAAAETAEAAE